MRRVLSGLLLLLLSLPLPAGIDFSGKVIADGSVGLPYADTAFELNAGKLTFSGELDAYSEKFSFHVDTALVLDGVTDYSRDNSYAFDSFKRAYLRLKEVYLDYYSDLFSLRAGRQIVTWGAADAIALTDVLCPQDMTSLTSYDMSESKLGIDALKLSFDSENTILDLYWVPLFTRTALPLESSNPLRSALVPSDVIQLNATDTATIHDFTSEDIESPELNLADGEYGLRLSRFLSYADFSLYGFYGFENVPSIGYALEGSAPSYTLDLDGAYHRMAMLGADTSIPISSKTLRVEGAYFPIRPFQCSAESQLGSASKSYEEHQMVACLLGIDWMPGDWSLTAQYYADWVFGDDENIERDSFGSKATLSLSRSFKGDELELGLSLILGLSDFDSVVNPSVKYRVSDEFIISLSLMMMNPGIDSDGEYGAYSELSSIVFRGTYSF